MPRSLHRHVYNLGLGELFQTFLTLFSPDTGLFGAAEGHLGMHIEMLVDPHRAGIDPCGHRISAIEIF